MGALTLQDGIPAKWITDSLAVFSNYTPQGNVISVGDPLKGTLKEILTLTEDDRFSDLEFSPDGKYVLIPVSESEEIPGRDYVHTYYPYLILARERPESKLFPGRFAISNVCAAAARH